MADTDKLKHYTEEELNEKGYNIKIPLDENTTLSSNQNIKTLIMKNNQKGFVEADRLENVAVKKKNERYFTIANSIYHKSERNGKLSTLYTLNYGNGDEEIVWLNEIEELRTIDLDNGLAGKVLKDF